MENKELLRKLNRLGYPLLETTGGFDINETLAEVVKTKDNLYWEGFPILLANAAKEDIFDYKRTEAFLLDTKDREHLKELFLLSLALYKLNDLHFDWASMYYAQRLTDNEKERVKQLKSCLSKDDGFEVAGCSFSPDRLKKTFQRYFTLEAGEIRDIGVKQEALSLEFALSQMFSPKQKEIFKKKLKGEVLTKTEKEYFSRAVKKKVLALANPELHRLAQKLLE